MISYGSVCSGIEAASVAWETLGFRPSWFSQFDPEHNYNRGLDFPSAVLDHHWPHVPNLGDMTTIAEAVRYGLIEAPDVLVGGTPCQAFSVAGLRGGLSDGRGYLTLKFVELANEIDRQRSQPAIIVWENVPGVLSSKDNAFGCFLAGLAGESEPLIPSGGKWSNSGYVSGPSRTVAWRILDAQYFGVAQRRRRVFVVASARDGFDPAAVLFEPDGVRRDTAPSREARQETATDAGSGATFSCGGIGAYTPDSIAATLLRSGQDLGQGCEALYAFQPRIGRNGRGDMGDMVNALTATAGETGKGDAAPCVAYGMQVRRLTPTECERLQGFPDGHTLIPESKRKKLEDDMREYLRLREPNLTDEQLARLITDGPRYKALGNSMAVPVMRWIGNRIILHILGAI